MCPSPTRFEGSVSLGLSMTPDPGSNAMKMISMMKKTVGFGCAAIEGRKEIHVEAGRLRRDYGLGR